MIASLIEQCLKRERATVLARLFHFSKDLSLAEEALQEASLKAFTVWPAEGTPERPGAWLFVVARRELIDRLRREARYDRPPDDAADEEAPSPAADAVAVDTFEHEAAPVEGSAQDREDRLQLLFTCCAAEVPERARVALALRSLLGLSTREIARAFLEQESATAKRLVRAKQAVTSAAPIATEGPRRAHAIETVLQTLYLVFNEGYLATEGETLLRDHLLHDALALAQQAADLLPWHAETHALLALMSFQASRQSARVSDEGALLTLEEQDRTLWHRDLIARGHQSLERAFSLQSKSNEISGVYVIQAAIAALHCEAATASETDWLQIAALYRLLVQHHRSPVIELNAAVALSMTGRRAEALSWVNALERQGHLKRYHLLAAVKARLLEEGGHARQAERYYRRARTLTGNPLEQRYLTRRIEQLALQRGNRPDP